MTKQQFDTQLWAISNEVRSKATQRRLRAYTTDRRTRSDQERQFILAQAQRLVEQQA